MDKEKFLEEIKDNSLEELELIYETQKDLYSEEEMIIIKSRISDFKKKEEEKLKKLLPNEIECPKCFGPNPFENNECSFCSAKLNKEKYYNLEYYENDKANDEIEEKTSYAFQYIISFLIPLVGFILGAILLSKEEAEEKEVGKICIMTAIMSMVISTMLIVMFLL